MPNIRGTMQGGNRGGLGQDSTYSKIKHWVMISNFNRIVAFPPQLDMPLLSLHYGLFVMSVSLLFHRLLLNSLELFPKMGTRVHDRSFVEFIGTLRFRAVGC